MYISCKHEHCVNRLFCKQASGKQIMYFNIPQPTWNRVGLKIITITCSECGFFFWMLKCVSLSMSVCLSAERRLHPDCILLDVYRVNPHCDWLIKPWKYSLYQTCFFYLEINVNNKQWHTESGVVFGVCVDAVASPPAGHGLYLQSDSWTNPVCWGDWRLNWIWPEVCVRSGLLQY